MTKSTLKVFVRKAGFWNARNFEISSQFGHIMVLINNNFYSFNQSKFIKGKEKNNVQKIDRKEFRKRYKNQIWHTLSLSLPKKDISKAVKYFNNEAKNLDYSIVNNCTRQCQIALEKTGIKFSRYFILPGSVLNFLKKKRDSLPVLNIEKIKV